MPLFQSPDIGTQRGGSDVHDKSGHDGNGGQMFFVGELVLLRACGGGLGGSGLSWQYSLIVTTV